MFVAGAYTRNILTGDSMDGADESGKRAAQAILTASGVSPSPNTPRCARSLSSRNTTTIAICAAVPTSSTPSHPQHPA